MITLRKIRTLRPRVQLRKAGSLMYQVARGEALDDSFIAGLEEIVLSLYILSEADRERLERLFSLYLETHDRLVAKDIHYLALEILGEEAGEWDFIDGDGNLDASSRTIKPHSLFLDRVRSPYNIGAIFRSAESFCIDHIYLREGCGNVESPRCVRTSRGAISTVPYSIVRDLSVLEESPVFALETGGEPLSGFSFPESGICVLGSEEDGVSPEVLAMCQSRVTIEQFGSKGSINVSVAAGILCYSWTLTL